MSDGLWHFPRQRYSDIAVLPNNSTVLPALVNWDPDTDRSLVSQFTLDSIYIPRGGLVHTYTPIGWSLGHRSGRRRILSVIPRHVLRIVRPSRLKTAARHGEQGICRH